MNTAVHFSSATVEWSTPDYFFKRLNTEFNFHLDVCATPQNRKCARFYTEADDGLSKSWEVHPSGAVWCNPPYKRGVIGKWVEKAHAEADYLQVTVVCLLPARTDTAWFQDYVLPYAELRFVRGRLKFGGSKNSAPFPSVVAIYRGHK